MATPEQDQLLQARYGGQAVPEHIVWNEQVAHLLRHRSVRAFLPEQLPTGALESIVAAGQSASTSSNLHQWSVVAVTDPVTKAELAHLARSESAGTRAAYIEEAPVVLLWVADMSRNHEITADRGVHPEVYEYVDAFLMASVDTALAAQNGVVAAESMGLGVCFLGMMRNHAKELADLIGLPKYSFVVFGMCVGRPDPARPGSIRPRPRQEVVLHRERYHMARPAKWLESYESAFHQFRERLGMSRKTWTTAVAYASTKPYMDGRENLRQAVEERGYLLR